MAYNFNKVIMMGRLTRDPELSHTNNDTPVVNFGLAVNRGYTTNGDKRTETCFVDCRQYGRQAEVIHDCFTKGRPIFVEGRLTFNEWEGKDGKKYRKHRVQIEKFEFIDPKPGEREAAEVAAIEDDSIEDSVDDFDIINEEVV